MLANVVPSAPNIRGVDGWCVAEHGFTTQNTTTEGAANLHATMCTSVRQLLQKDGVHPSRAKPRVRARLIFGTCVKNAAKQLRASISFIEALGAAAAAYEVIVFEDGSRDDTRNILKQWASRNARVHAIFAQKMSVYSMRTQHIALCRNVVLQEAFKAASVALGQQSRHRDTPTLMVALDADCDHRIDDVLPGVQAAVGAIESQPMYAVLSANSLPFYYDLWVLRSRRLLIDYDCFLGDKCVRGRCNYVFGMGGCRCEAGWRETVNKGTCFDYEVSVHPRAPIFDIDSGFDGLAVYNLAAINATRCGFNGDLRVEHVAFHQCLRSSGLRIALVPGMVQGCGQEHMRKLGMGIAPKKGSVRVTATGEFVYSTNLSRTTDALERAAYLP
jgi:hypothetical protein